MAKDLARRRRRGQRPSGIRERGLTLIETALALAVMAIVVASLSLMMAENADQIRARAAADKVTEVHEAAKGYIKANYAALLAATAAGPQVVPSGRQSAVSPVPANSLQAGGYLPSGYVDSNGYGQQHSLIVRRVAGVPTALEAIVTTHGGRDIPDRQLGKIANFVGAAGGYVPAVHAAAADTGQVVGSYGGWRTPVAGWGPVTTRPSAGTIQATLAFEDGNLLTDYLYRNDIGVPEANRMNTAIDMNGNDINNIEDAYAINLWASQNIRADRNVTAGVNVAAGNDVTAGNDVVANRNMVATTGSMTANQNVTATLGNVTAGRDGVIGQDLRVGRDATIGNPVTDVGNLVVGNKTTTRDFKTELMNIDAVVYNDSPGGNNRGLAAAAGVRLGDLLPRMVPQYSYRVLHGNTVPKPNCGGDRSRARIMVYKQSDSARGFPFMDLQTQMASIPDAGTVVGRAWQGSGAYVDIYDAVNAVDNGLTWTVRWAGLAAAPANARQAIAQTLCFYG